MRFILAATIFIFAAGFLRAADWPQFLGPTRNSVSPTQPDSIGWAKSGPEKLWSHPVGKGWSGPIVAKDRVIIFHRQAENEIIDCLDAKTGRSIWYQKFPTEYVDGFGFDNGPRATPCIRKGRVYLFGADGNLHCLAMTDGKAHWSINLKKTFTVNSGFFGLACSPIVMGDKVLVNIGGANGAGIVGVNTNDGSIAWKTHDDTASYSSPAPINLKGSKQVAFVTRNNVVSVDPLTGKQIWQHRLSPAMQASVSASTPLLVGEHLFATASYGAGAVALRLTPESAKMVWQNDRSLSSQYHTPVELNGYLYGFHGRLDTGPKPDFRCINLKSGDIKWKMNQLDAGSIIRTGNQILVVTVNGQLIRAAISPKECTVLARNQIQGFETRAHPALADGILYTRDKKKLIAVRVSE